MALHLVGETIDKTRSHYGSETGKLVHLTRGIYVDALDDIDAIVQTHAVRIAKYLYPNAYLSAASAVLLGPTPDGRLFLSGRRKHRARIRALEIVQNTAPEHPSVAPAVVNDGMGELTVQVSSMRQRLLEAFRVRSEHAASIDATMREVIAQRLIEEYGTDKDAANAVWALARETGWLREAESAERLLMRRPAAVTPVRNEAALELIVAWHGAPVGRLVHDGFEWRWTAVEGIGQMLIRQTTPGKLPPFIVSLLPEGWLETVLKDRDERETLKLGKRYMSNITVVERMIELAALPPDLLMARLAHHTKDGVFTGTYSGPRRDELDKNFESNLARIYEQADTPRLSGVQIKAPMFLDRDATLSPAVGKPFTHILKPAGTGGFEALPVVEWLALGLGRAIGFAVPDAVLTSMPDDLPPALIVERFDIRSTLDDKRLIALEDFCSVLGLDSADKYKSTIERVARAIRSVSTAPDQDVTMVLKRALFAWLIADGDMHLKNLALLKTADAGGERFLEVRMAPLYDAVTTRVFPRLKKDRMALKLNGKDDKLRRADFHALASTAGLKAREADAVIDDVIARMGEAVNRVALPKLPNFDAGGEFAARMLEIIQSRLASFK